MHTHTHDIDNVPGRRSGEQSRFFARRKKLPRLGIAASILAAAVSLCSNANAADPPIWNDYKAARAAGNALPMLDYSYAGYDFGESGIPDTNSLGLPIFNVTSYGAVANDNNSDRAAIQAALNAAKNAGGGIVKFPVGTFLVNETANLTAGIVITHGQNIIMSGTRNSSGMTRLFMRQPLFPPSSGAAVPGMFEFISWGGGAQPNVTSSSEIGDLSIRVNSTSGLGTGDFVILNLEGNPSLNSRYLGGQQLRFNWSNMATNGVTINEHHRIKSISGNTITFHAPITTKIRPADGFKLKKTTLRQHIGIEDIHFEGNYTQSFQHHQAYNGLDWYHDHAFAMVKVLRGYNSWVRRCKFSNTSDPFGFGASLACSAINNTYEGNPGHNWAGFGYGSTRCFEGLSEIKSAVFHGTGFNNSFGNVVWRTNAPTVGGVDFHANTVRMTLVDECIFNGMTSNGGNFVFLPNHLDGCTYWNYKNVGSGLGNYNFWNVAGSAPYPPGVKVVRPNVIGYHGSSGSFSNAGRVESLGSAVSTGSLYEAQLKLRLGSTPSWIAQARQEHSSIFGGGAGGGGLPPIGSIVSLKGTNGKYVSSENGSQAMTCNRTVVGSYERFTVVDAGSGKIAFKGNNGEYVSSENGSKPMTCNRGSMGSWEKFTLSTTGTNQVSIKGSNNKFVSSENGNRPIICNRNSAQGWEKFTWTVQ